MKATRLVIGLWAAAMLALQVWLVFELRSLRSSPRASGEVEAIFRDVGQIKDEVRSMRQATPGAPTPMSQAADPYADIDINAAR